jgi:hypothetical protein
MVSFVFVLLLLGRASLRVGFLARVLRGGAGDGTTGMTASVFPLLVLIGIFDGDGLDGWMSAEECIDLVEVARVWNG